MDRIKELLGRIQDLSDEELVELRDLILQQFDEFGEFADAAKAPVELLASLADAADAFNNEQKRRAQRAKRAGTARQTLASLRAGAHGILEVPHDRRPRPSVYGVHATAVTAAGVPIADKNDLAEQFVATIKSRREPNSRQGRVLVASVHADAPHREVMPGDPVAAMLAISNAADAHAGIVAAALRDARTDPEALTAAGGLGAPTDTDYALPGFEVTDRPVKAALPTFTTNRGGVRFVRPPLLADVNGGVGIWDVTDDIAAVTDPLVRKPSVRPSVNAEIEVTVQAITNILTVGNLMARAYPEWVARVIDLMSAQHARIAEQQLLTQIGALSTAVTGAADEGAGLGATRVLLPLLDRAATGMRNRMRMRPDAPLQLILPDWARGILRSDLAMQEPGDGTLGVTDVELTQYLATRNIAPTWAMDGEAGQQFNPQTAGPVTGWPTSVIAYMFPAGAFQFLDGGTLDLGIVRDSTMNAANDHQVFSETFEGVLFRGGEAFRIAQPVTPSGIARAAETPATG